MRNRHAFGLLEILVALGILVVAFVPVAGMAEQGSRSARWCELQAKATLRAAELLDRHAARPFAELEEACGSCVSGEQESLEIHLAEEGLVLLRASVSFELPGAGRRPRHVFTLDRIVARPDASFVAAPPAAGIS